jgi:hypothetical protein
MSGKTQTLMAAFVAAQGEFQAIEKNAIGYTPDGREFRFADLDELIKKTRPALAQFKLGVLQPVMRTERGLELVTMLVHESGEKFEASIPINEQFTDLKALGACLSYLRRYAYRDMLCLSAEDVLDQGDYGATGGLLECDELPPFDPEPPQDRQPEPPEESTDSRPTLSDKEFQDNLAAYRTAISAGKKSPEQIRRLIESRNRLTDEQREQLFALAPKDSQEAAQ